MLSIELPVNIRSENKQLTLNMANTLKLSNRLNFDFKGTYFNNTSVSGKHNLLIQIFFPYEHLADANGNALPVTLIPFS